MTGQGMFVMLALAWLFALVIWLIFGAQTRSIRT